jgi:hypothetical protein
MNGIIAPFADPENSQFAGDKGLGSGIRALWGAAMDFVCLVAAVAPREVLPQRGHDLHLVVRLRLGSRPKEAIMAPQHGPLGRRGFRETCEGVRDPRSLGPGWTCPPGSDLLVCRREDDLALEAPLRRGFLLESSTEPVRQARR